MKACGEEILFTIQLLVNRWGMLGLLASNTKKEENYHSMAAKEGGSNKIPMNKKNHSLQ